MPRHGAAGWPGPEICLGGLQLIPATRSGEPAPREALAGTRRSGVTAGHRTIRTRVTRTATTATTSDMASCLLPPAAPYMAVLVAGARAHGGGAIDERRGVIDGREASRTHPGRLGQEVCLVLVRGTANAPGRKRPQGCPPPPLPPPWSKHEQASHLLQMPGASWPGLARLRRAHGAPMMTAQSRTRPGGCLLTDCLPAGRPACPPALSREGRPRHGFRHDGCARRCSSTMGKYGAGRAVPVPGPREGPSTSGPWEQPVGGSGSGADGDADSSWPRRLRSGNQVSPPHARHAGGRDAHWRPALTCCGKPLRLRHTQSFWHSARLGPARDCGATARHPSRCSLICRSWPGLAWPGLAWRWPAVAEASLKQNGACAGRIGRDTAAAGSLLCCKT